MEKLPPEIALEIFYRLPAESVVRCKLVCKSWYSLLPRGRGDEDGNYFANMHLRRRHHLQRNLDDYSTFNCIALQEFRDINDQEEEGSVVGGEFHIAEYNEVEGLHCTVKRLHTFSHIRISRWFMMNMPRLVGSCNGLLYFTITYYREEKTNEYFLENRIGICNPLLHEYVILPLSDLQFFSNYRRIGFGHNPITDEYKVVRVYYQKNWSCIGYVEVYTLGKSGSSNGAAAAGMWRSKGTINYSLHNWSLYNVFIDGSVHWLAKADEMSEQNNIIVSFDLEDEEFRVIRLPSNLNISNKAKLRELRGCLCLIEETTTRGQNINLDIWVLKKKKDYIMNKEEEEESWVKEFSIKWAVEDLSRLPWYSPIAIIKKKDGDDAILCWCQSNNSDINGLVSYDPKTQNFKKVGGKQDVNGLIFDSVLHINSLVSLKALGEDAKYAKETPKTILTKGKSKWVRLRRLCACF